MSRNADPNIHKKITRLYLLALTAVAVLTIGGQWLMQKSLSSQLSDSKVVNVAGRQRMLSQKITKTVLLLNYAPDSATSETYLADLDAALELWSSSHVGLKEANLGYLHTSVKNSETINKYFNILDPTYKAIYQNARAISAYFHTHTFPPDTNELRPYIQVILRNERNYLSEMDRIVFQYDAEAKERVNHSRQIEITLLGLTLAILLLEGLFIFRPAVREIKRTIALLIYSELETKQKNEELKQANQSLEETREALVKATESKYQQELNEQKLRAAYLIEGQEEERKRVSKEIHDGLGQMLTAMKFGIERIGDSVNVTEKAQKDLTALREMVNQTISEARAISFDLMPAVLNDFGVSSAIKLLASQLSTSSGTSIIFNTNCSGIRLPKNIEIGLYRITQEALHNALKYAKAPQITVELSVKKRYIHLKVLDNGAGFEYDSLRSVAENAGPGHGISNMKERVYILNGYFDFISKPGEGTQLLIKVPLINQLHEQY